MNFLTKEIKIDNKLVAIIFKYKKEKFKGISFFTNKILNLQVGLMVHGKNHTIKPHIHLNKKKVIKQMSELLIIFSGKLKVFFYNKKKIKTKSIILNKRDMILLISGIHGFKVLKNLEMIEIKQGPFFKKKDKVLLENF